MTAVRLTILCMALFAASVLGFYEPSDRVITLTPENFGKMEKSKAFWLVEFFAPWCGHCKNLAPEWKKAAKALHGIIRLGAVDADKHRELGSKFGVNGFPTIKVFGADKRNPSDYGGGRTALEIINEAFKGLETHAISKLK